MNKDREMIYGRPLCFLALSVILGSYLYVLINTYFLIGVALATLFFIILICTLNRKFMIINITLLLVACLNIFYYYNINLPRSHIEKIKIIEADNGKALGKCRGKFVNIYELYGVEEGEEIVARVNFYKNSDYENGIVGNISLVKIENVEKTYLNKVYNMKVNYYERLCNELGKENSGVVIAMALGDKRFLYDKYESQMKELGIIHVTAISGFHIGVVYSVIYSILGIAGGVVGVTVYLIVVGLKVSSVRAYIMILTYIVGKKIYRNNDSLSSLSLSCIIVLFIYPFSVTDIGFALSFLATLGIVLYSKIISRVFYKLPTYLNKTISLSLSAQSLTIPYMMIMFKSLSLSFLVGNIFLIPLVSIIIILGNIGMLICDIEILYGLFTIVFKIVIDIFVNISYGATILSPKSIKVGFKHACFYILIFWLLIYNWYRRDEENDRFNSI